MLLIAVFCCLVIISAGCLEMPTLGAPEAATPATAIATPQGETGAGGSPAAAAISLPADTVTAMNAITSMEISTEPIDWDSTPGNNGFVIHFLFYDSAGRVVTFSGASLTAEVKVHTPDTNIYSVAITPRLLYKGYTTITRSDEGEPYPMRGIRIPYSDIALTSGDRGIGKVSLKVWLPNGRTLQAEETYLYTK